MRIANTVSDSIVDGPGLRFTVFTQGCPQAATTRTPTIRWAGMRRRWTSWRRSCCPIR